MRATRTIPLLLPLVLAACGGGGSRVATRPLHPGGGTYTAPGPASDPWGPYIHDASARFNVPEQWIRAVMRQESGGQEYLNGEPITSSAGAMGLMQLMPATYADMRDRYGLGDDPYQPRDNIVAGTAYISLLYAAYGSPAFLAAYNAGPTRLQQYLAQGTSLPNETVNYVASVAPTLGGPMTGPLAAYADQGAAGQAAAEPVQVAEAAPPAPIPTETTVGSSLWSPTAPTAVTAAPLPPPQQPPPRPAGFALIGAAYADTLPPNPANASWGVQVGAFTDPTQARQVAETARHIAPSQLAPATTVVGSVTHPDGQTFYRARLIGITEPAADTACGTLVAQRWACLTVPPGG
jgi:D-alanyl-D-alanine carboxypeptidase